MSFNEVKHFHFITNTQKKPYFGVMKFTILEMVIITIYFAFLSIPRGRGEDFKKKYYIFFIWLIRPGTSVLRDMNLQKIVNPSLGIIIVYKAIIQLNVSGDLNR